MQTLEREMPPAAVARLATRRPLPLDAASSIAIKRDVHEFEVEADAAAFAGAFRRVVTDPESRFGLIRVKRPAQRLGQDFEVGERFQGCFSLQLAAPRWLGALLGAAPGLTRAIEDALLSNYAEVRAIDMQPGSYRLEYAYLEGTPIAGRSIFTIEPAGAGRCRVRQVFEYQEVNGIALATFQRFGLKYHDQVVHMEIEQAAALLGARVISNTIPRAYAVM